MSATPASQVKGVRHLFIRTGLYIALVLFLAFLLLPPELALPVLILEYVVLGITFYFGYTTQGNALYRFTHKKRAFN